MKLRFSVCLFPNTHIYVWRFFRTGNCHQKVFPILALEFGKPPEFPCSHQKEAMRTWLSVPHTCCKSDSSPPQITTVDPPNLWWCYQSPESPKPLALTVTHVPERGWMVDVTNQEEGLSPFCCTTSKDSMLPELHSSTSKFNLLCFPTDRKI